MIRAALAFAIFLAAFPALAQATCGPRDIVTQALLDGYGERPAMRGATLGGNAVEVLVSPTGSWTMIHIQPNGIACLMAAGEGWEKTAPVKPAGRGT